ncbi:MAG: BamA/TamA family outer membrane protein [Sandaracinus sp.]|nr:BamA/TamA family outer membrane protein [Sandaracinus sp.]MCB9618131.1 BamA/TamA family outer membrane protein [Sandaracinus sp.]
MASLHATRLRRGLGLAVLSVALAAGVHAQPPEAAPEESAPEVLEAAEEAPTTAEGEGDTSFFDEEPTPDDEGDGDTEPPPEGAEEDDFFDTHGRDDVESRDVRVRYFVEAVRIQGNTRTRSSVIRRYVPYERGAVLDPEDEELETLTWRLRGTGWFDEVSLRLEPGERRGWVVLVIRVVERNTIAVGGLTFGISEGVQATRDTSVDLLPYVGFTLTESNFLGSGSSLSASVLLSSRANGFRLEHEHPRLFKRDWSLRSAFFYHRARQYFGNDPLIDAGECDPDDADCLEEIAARNAVVFYQRGGVVLGTGHDLGASTRFFLDWQGEMVDLRSRPDAASERFGSMVRPIDFAIEDGLSFVSLVRFGLVYDRRDDPVVTTRGLHVRFTGELSHPVLGSDYDFVRTQLSVRGWVPLPWGHTLRLSLFAGGVIGQAPFFHQFHIADLTDLVPGRMLEMQLDRRRAPNFFGTAIAPMRVEEVAARVDVQYELPLYRSRKGLRALDLYVNGGLLLLADWRDLRVAVPGYEGAARLPVDLTFDIGLRMDTRVGTFQLGFSTLLGFLDL